MSFSTEGLARATARRPWITIGAWALVVMVAMALISTLLDDALTTEFAMTNNPDSVKANSILEEKVRGPRKIREFLVVRHDTLTVDDDAFRQRVERLYDDIIAIGPDVIEGGTNYYQSNDPFIVSRDRRTTLIPLVMAGSVDEATDAMESLDEGDTGLLDMVRAEDASDGFKVLIAGEASIAAESNELSVADIEKGERIGVPAALVILLLLFGALVAALMPIALAILAIIIALGLTALLGLAFDLIFFVTLMISMIGLAVGIDYSLIFVSRFREELSKVVRSMTR